MKTQIKKLISVFACVCLLLTAIIIPVSAETTATITFDDSSKAEWSTTQQLWQENGITVTNNKASSTNNIDTSKKYSNPARFYKGSEVIVEYPGMTQIVFDANSASYATALSGAITVGTVTVDSDKVTVVFDAPVDSYTVSISGGQVRMDAITVTAVLQEGACAHEDTTATSNGDERHSVVCNNCGETVSISAECVDSDKDGACDTCTGAVEIPFDPTGKTAAEIVDAAYALEVGESFETNATLTGVITAVNTAYSEQYGNVTVTIAVEGKEDKPIECYRLAGEGADTITVEDTITVTGILTNYNGKIEFAQGCTLDAVVKGDLVIEIPEDPKEIVDAAFALEAGTSLLYEATLQGAIVEINTPYDEGYGNITVTIAVEGTTETKNLLCYRMKAADGQDASALKVGDVIEVTGTIKNYNDTIEYDTGCTFVLIEAAPDEGGDPVDPPVEDPDEPTTNSATYVFSDYVIEGELGGSESTRELDSNVTFTISSGWFTTQARVYKNANAVLTSKVDISSIAINVGSKDSTFNVYTSTDGETWTLSHEDVAYTSAYSDVTIAFETPVKYIKIDAVNAQIRMKTMTVNFEDDSQGSEPVDPPVEDPDVPVDPNAPAFYIEDVTASAGETVDVKVAIRNNPGFVSAKLAINYDSDVLELVGKAAGENFGGMAFSQTLDANPYIVNWVDSINPDNTANDVFVTLTFKVKEGVADGDYDITITYDPEDVYNANFDNVEFATEAGTVSVVSFVRGDVDGDGSINNRDLGKLMQHLNAWEIEINLTAADANGDGSVNNKDYGLLMQYVNKWNVELG